MQLHPQYEDVVAEIAHFFDTRLQACEQAGISRDRIYLDPGFGFGKTLAHNLSLLANITRFSDFGCPLVIGLSRKSMWGQLLGCAPEDRLIGSVTAATIAALQADVIIRAHDVAATRQAIQIIQAVRATAILNKGTYVGADHPASLSEFGDGANNTVSYAGPGRVGPRLGQR